MQSGLYLLTAYFGPYLLTLLNALSPPILSLSLIHKIMCHLIYIAKQTINMTFT